MSKAYGYPTPEMRSVVRAFFDYGSMLPRTLAMGMRLT